MGVSMDAAAVSAARGLALGRVRVRHVALVALFFGGFQALMPALGFLIGDRIGHFVQAWDHWVVFAVLGVIGGRMIAGAVRGEHHEERVDPSRLFAPMVLLALAVATSLDAFAVGMTLPMLQLPLVASVAAMGLTTAALSALAIVAGGRLGERLGPRLEIVGGVILIAVGARILFEHLSAA